MPRPVLALVLVALLLAPAARAEQITAEHNDSEPIGSVSFGWYESRRYGQVFEAAIGGRLTAVDIVAGQSGSHATYRFEVFAVDDENQPVDPPLFSKVYDASVAPGGGGFQPFRFVLDEAVHLDAGSRYAWVVGTGADNPTAHSSLRRGSGPYEHPAIGRNGGPWSATTSYVYYFTAFVADPVSAVTASWGEVKAGYGQRR